MKGKSNYNKTKELVNECPNGFNYEGMSFRGF